jgi:hypothetical protein
MPTPQSRRTSTGRSRTTSGRGRHARNAATPRRSAPTIGLRRRRQPSPTGVKKVTAAAGKALPSSGKGKAGGAALIATAAAAAGLALKNKDKLVGKVKQPDQHAGNQPTNATAPPAPVT